MDHYCCLLPPQTYAAHEPSRPATAVSVHPADSSSSSHILHNHRSEWSTTKPGVVDADRQPILETSELYSGIYGRASINFYAFNSNGNRGIACGLNNLQKIRDGEPLGGKASAASDFATDSDDDFLA